MGIFYSSLYNKGILSRIEKVKRTEYVLFAVQSALNESFKAISLRERAEIVDRKEKILLYFHKKSAFSSQKIAFVRLLNLVTEKFHGILVFICFWSKIQIKI